MNIRGFFKKGKGVVMRLVHLKYKKYVIVLAVGVFLVGFLGDNSVVAHLHSKAYIAELKAEIARYRADTQEKVLQVSALQTTLRAVNRVAYEKHFFKRADEDVFVLSDEIDPAPNSDGHEAAQ